MISAAMKHPCEVYEVHVSKAVDMNEASEPPEDDTEFPRKGKRFDCMNEPDKKRESTLDQLFFKIAKYNP